MRSLFDALDQNEVQTLVRPRPLMHSDWPPDYQSVYKWRYETLKRLRDNPAALKSAKIYYSTRPLEFINDWMDTYDPRKADRRWMPFVFFSKQAEVIQFIEDLCATQENGLVEKCRDAGLSWICAAWTVWAWIFKVEFAIGWGSKKEDSVDKRGDPNSLFEKMRILISRLHKMWLPESYTAKRMLIINNDNKSTIFGDIGDGIGRGSRSAVYFVDEAAHLERPALVDSSLSATTNVRIDISSVNGFGNAFHRRREAGVIWTPPSRAAEPLPKGYTRVFIMDWRDHPNKTQEWYDITRARYEREGNYHIFAQEVERNYSAAISNTIISMDWIQAAVDAHLHIPSITTDSPRWYAGLDVADSMMGAGDRNALTLRQGVIWRECHEWGDKDAGKTAQRAMSMCQPYNGRIECHYDSIGVGSSVKSEYNRLCEEGVINPETLPFVPWNAGAAVMRPYDRIIPDDDQSMMNIDFFDNLKAQAWWSLRTRFYKTYKAKTEGIIYNPEELISLDSSIPLLQQLMKELAQPTEGRSSRLKMLVEKKPNSTRSPNLADSGVMAFHPVPIHSTTAQVGNYGY